MDLSALGDETCGVWTTAQARAVGLSNEQVEHRVDRGEWQRLRRGVLTDAGVVPDAAMRAWAAIVAVGATDRAWAAGRTTARLLQLPLIDDQDPATKAADLEHDDVAVRRDRHPAQRPTLHLQRLNLGDAELTTIAGCPSLTLERALPGLSAVLTHEALVCLLDAALYRHLLDTTRLAAVVRSCAGRPYARALATAADAADARSESPAETLARLLLLPVLPGLVPQVELFDRAARLVARFDLGDEELRFAVEADGKRGHAGGQMVAKDRRRDRTSSAMGWTTERCTWWELRREPVELRQRMVTQSEQLTRRRAG